MRSIWGYQHQSQALANDRMQGSPPNANPSLKYGLNKDYSMDNNDSSSLNRALFAVGGVLALGGYLVPLDFHDKWLNAKKKTTFPKHLKFTLFQEARPQINTQKHHCCLQSLRVFLSRTCLTLGNQTIQQKKGQGTINPVWGKPKLCTSASTSIQRYQLASLSLLSQRKCPRDGASIFWPPNKMRPSFLHSSDMKQHQKKNRKKKVAQQKLYKQTKNSVSLDVFLYLCFSILHPNKKPPQSNGPLGPTLQSHLPPPSHDDASVR